MTVIEALESMEAAPLGNARLEALQQADSPELRKMLTLALSPQITFGMKKLPEPKADAIPFAAEQVWHRNMLTLLDNLQTRTLSGNHAQTAVSVFLGACDPIQRKWSERIIRQDLRLNLGAKDVNNVFGEGTIFQFGVPLAEDFAKVDPKHYKGRWVVEAKLDGARCVVFMPANKGRVTLFSRSGKEYINFESVRTKLQEINDTRNPVQDLVLDGEVVSYVGDHIDFQALQHTLFRKDGVESGRLKILVFDGTTQADWLAPKKTYEERYKFTAALIKESLNIVNGAVNKVGMVDMFVTTDPDRERMVKHSREFVERGYEGAMFRKADEPPVLKRSRSLLKVKTFIDATFEIYGAVSGTGKYEGILGALQARTLDTKKEFEMGSGFSDDQRREIWRLFKAGNLPRLADGKYQELTDDGIPRFPIFKGFRHEDDISNG